MTKLKLKTSVLIYFLKPNKLTAFLLLHMPWNIVQVKHRAGNWTM